MKGHHRQLSVLSTLLKHDIVAENKVDIISADFLKQSKPFIRFLIEDKN